MGGDCRELAARSDLPNPTAPVVWILTVKQQNWSNILTSLSAGGHSAPPTALPSCQCGRGPGPGRLTCDVLWKLFFYFDSEGFGRRDLTSEWTGNRTDSSKFQYIEDDWKTALSRHDKIEWDIITARPVEIKQGPVKYHILPYLMLIIILNKRVLTGHRSPSHDIWINCS